MLTKEITSALCGHREKLLVKLHSIHHYPHFILILSFFNPWFLWSMFFKTVHLRLEGNIKGLKLPIFFFIYKKWEIVRNGGRVMDRERCRKCWKEERWRKLDASYQKSKHVDLFFWEVDWASFWPYIVLSLVFSLPSRKAVAGEKRSFIGARLREGVSLQLFFYPLLLLLRYHILLSL